jgi:chorismate synthase
MVAAIDSAAKAGDTLGGVAEVVVRGLVAGLGSHVSWDRKLDGQLAGALMSIQAVKGVEIGGGFGLARLRGSEAHDEILRGDREAAGGFVRATNRAGGLEGGITTGEPLVLRLAMKPIPTLRQSLRTVNLQTGLADKAHSERSDTTAVPAMGVIAEAMVALVLANAAVEKFGGDSMREVRDNARAYVARINARVARW